ncbi:MAG: GAF domain-containing protein [Phycisphaerae bacterium]
MQRDYSCLLNKIMPDPDRRRSMIAFVDIIWSAFHPTGVSWVGFYLHDAEGELTLAACRNNPACSPIGLHGACGQALTSREPLIIRDVSELGDHYIACDPRDRSELVIPLFDASGMCWGVIDLDSHIIGAFRKDDVQGLTRLLLRAGLTCEP